MRWTDPAKFEHTSVDVTHLRKFGVVMAAAVGVISLVMWRHGSGAFVWALLVAGIFFSLGLLMPRFLAPVEKVWMVLAEKISIVMTLLILTVTFFFLITPVGLLRRWVLRDSFELGFDRQQPSYWKPVEPNGPASRPDKPY